MDFDLKDVVEPLVGKVCQQTISRAVRAANVIRSAAEYVLNGQRSGRMYRRGPGGGFYTASAPGEAPTVRSGILYKSWHTIAASDKTAKGVVVRPGIRTDVPYAPKLEHGTRRMQPRPYTDAVIARAKPKVEAIFRTPYL